MMTDEQPQTFYYQVLNDPNNTEQGMKWRRAVFDWWLGLENHKGERAELRRCQHGDQVMQNLLGYFRLASKLDKLPVSPRALASVAYLLSYIKPDNAVMDKLTDQQNMAKKQEIENAYFEQLMQASKGMSWYLGQEAGKEHDKPSGKPIFSTLRFQRLLQGAAETEHKDFDISFRRAIRQLQGKTEQCVNPIITADQILYRYRSNSSPEKYRGSRKFGYQFAKDYYRQVLRYDKDSQGA